MGKEGSKSFDIASLSAFARYVGKEAAEFVAHKRIWLKAALRRSKFKPALRRHEAKSQPKPGSREPCLLKRASLWPAQDSLSVYSEREEFATCRTWRFGTVAVDKELPLAQKSMISQYVLVTDV
jgi:hypothetical protein